MNRLRLKRAATALGAVFVLFGCGNTSGGGTEQLAADQTLRFPYNQDVVSLDPGHTEWATDVPLVNEMFDGLLTFDNSLKEVPDIAAAMPEVSADGKTYTFKLKKNVKFWNGDPVTAKDFIYSWSRAAWLNDDYAVMVEPIDGAADVEKHKTKTIAGLSAPDDYTLKVQLSEPAGYWLIEAGLWTTKVVDQKVIGDYTDTNNKLNDDWWTDPKTAVGTGPYKLTSRVPKASLAFERVDNWWGSNPGSIKKVEITIGEDQSAAVKKYESGGYDLIGFGNQSPSPDDMLRYKNDPAKAKEYHNYTSARTTWVSFNLSKPPFSPRANGIPVGQQTGGLSDDVGKPGRHALSIAIDRSQLADVACTKNILCQPATGGWITKGLQAYLGDNSDPNAKFDAAAAKAEYQQWDPDGSKAKQMSYTYNTGDLNKKVAENLQSQWKNNLGITVNINGIDLKTFSAQRKSSSYIMNRGSWGADYDHPQDWFDNMMICAQAPKGGTQGTAYCNPALDKLVQKADTLPLKDALPSYQQAGKILYTDIPMAMLFYGTQPYFVHTYVQGYGYNGLFDYNWEGMKILKH